MNKERFLNELREYLSILEDQEQEDILAEYTQHIDMKLQKGLSEEEAIRDFGSVKELAAEILAAYHVDSQHALSVGRRGTWSAAADGKVDGTGRPGLRRNQRGTGWPGLRRNRSGTVRLGQSGKEDRIGQADELPAFGPEQEEREEGGNAFARACRRIREILARAAQGVVEGCRRFCRALRGIGAWCRKPFAARRGKAGPADGSDEAAGEYAGHDAFAGNDGALQRKREEMKETKERSGTMGRMFRAVGHGTVRLWQWVLSCCIFWLRLIWNAGWLLLGLFCAGMTLITLMGVGAIPVFLIQGYPFVGIFMICLGGLLCLGTLTCWSFSMMVRSKKDITAIEEHGSEESDEEVTYE